MSRFLYYAITGSYAEQPVNKVGSITIDAQVRWRTRELIKVKKEQFSEVAVMSGSLPAETATVRGESQIRMKRNSQFALEW